MMPGIILFVIWSLLAAFSAASFAGEAAKTPDNQTLIIPNQSPGVKAPLVVIYTLSTCPHCRDAKEYLKNNNIPFINLEIDTNEENMAALMKIYDSMGVPAQNRGVPLFVIDNRIKVQGLNKEKLHNALEEVTSKPK
jgi:glutaredoxin 3